MGGDNVLFNNRLHKHNALIVSNFKHSDILLNKYFAY
jgi:hypothetical protein